MRTFIMIASIAAMAVAAPALAQGRGKGHGQGNQQGVQHRANPGVQHRAHPHGCPPGLARQGTGCVPPGQARRLFNVGQRLPSSFRYAQIPVQYRDQITYDPRYRYSYNNGLVYVVDPRTRLVRSIVDLIP